MKNWQKKKKWRVVSEWGKALGFWVCPQPCRRNLEWGALPRGLWLAFLPESQNRQQEMLSFSSHQSFSLFSLPAVSPQRQRSMSLSRFNIHSWQNPRYHLHPPYPLTERLCRLLTDLPPLPLPLPQVLPLPLPSLWSLLQSPIYPLSCTQKNGSPECLGMLCRGNLLLLLL